MSIHSFIRVEGKASWLFSLACYLPGHRVIKSIKIISPRAGETRENEARAKRSGLSPGLPILTLLQPARKSYVRSRKRRDT